jgi:hypothetical protein
MNPQNCESSFKHKILESGIVHFVPLIVVVVVETIKNITWIL